jgi:hypothetical protein
VFSAVGVDRGGDKHVLGIEIGAAENAAAVKDMALSDEPLITHEGVQTGESNSC